MVIQGLVLTISAGCQIEKMLKVDPKARLTTGDILKHPWMTDKAEGVAVADKVKHKLATFVEKRKKKRRNSDSEVTVAKPSHSAAAAILARRGNQTCLM